MTTHPTEDPSLIHSLGEVLLEAREEAGISRERLAATEPEGVTTNSLFRFEKGRNARYWPRDPEALVQLYADAIGVAPVTFWRAALDRYEKSLAKRRKR